MKKYKYRTDSLLINADREDIAHCLNWIAKDGWRVINIITKEYYIIFISEMEAK